MFRDECKKAERISALQHAPYPIMCVHNGAIHPVFSQFILLFHVAANPPPLKFGISSSRSLRAALSGDCGSNYGGPSYPRHIHVTPQLYVLSRTGS